MNTLDAHFPIEANNSSGGDNDNSDDDDDCVEMSPVQKLISNLFGFGCVCECECVVQSGISKRFPKEGLKLKVFATFVNLYVVRIM